MASLTFRDAAAMEAHAATPLAADRGFLASLQRLTDPVLQQRAEVFLHLAAGAVPPPPVLVWAGREVMSQLRAAVREHLAAAGGAGGAEAAGEITEAAGEGTEGQDAASAPGSSRAAADLTALRSEPWYEGVLQLARLAVGAKQAPSPSPDGTAAPPAATELELLRAFAGVNAAGRPAPGGAAPPYLPWPVLLESPHLPRLLAVAAARSPELAATLELTGLAHGTAAEAEAASGPGRQDWLLPRLQAVVAAARQRALEALGLAAEPPLDADAVLSVTAASTAGDAGPAAAARRAAAAEWAAAAGLLSYAEERLGCTATAAPPAAVQVPYGSADASVVRRDGVRQSAVALMQLLGLPLQPQGLDGMAELQVSDAELRGWIAQAAAQLQQAPGSPSAPLALAPPEPLSQRLSSARRRLAAAGRALVLAAEPPAAAATAGDSTAFAPPPAAWLQAVGAPLASGLLSGGYSLAQLRRLDPELREALLLRLLLAGRTAGGAAAAAGALYADAAAAWGRVRGEAAGVAAAAGRFEEEAREAALDLVHERFVPSPSLPPPPAPLPRDQDLAAALAALPPAQLDLHRAHQALREGAEPAAAVAAAELGNGAAAAVAGQEVPAELEKWLSSARGTVLRLPEALRALLLRFLRVQVNITPEAAQTQRNKLLLLAAIVAERQAAAAAAGAGAGAGAGAEGAVAGEGERAAEARAAREISIFWRGAHAPATAYSDADAAAAAAATGAPAALSDMLGWDGARDFATWLKDLALDPASYRRSAEERAHAAALAEARRGGGRPMGQPQPPRVPSPGEATAAELLAPEQLAQDVERYLAMTHDPALQLRSTAAVPTSTSWSHPGLRTDEREWLGGMRQQLDAYLEATGHAPLAEGEWGMYLEGALQEWEAGREERGAKLAAAGQSGFFNPRADEVYLQELLERNIPEGDPLGAASRRYLDTLLRNPTWSFAQRRQAVQRLIELNAHFAAQPPAPAEGSPFAPLFAPGGPEVVPKLARAAPRGGGPPAPPLELPKGF